MIIQHNLLAQNSNRQLRIHQQSIGKNMEKLSTGYRVNRAADDAAGLSISEKMRAQIRGLNRASKNIQDGISLIQTAEGALQETHSVLQRMRELSVQAANDTYVTADREAIQQEMVQLTAEVDRIAHHTEFNNGIYPLLGAGNEIDTTTNPLSKIFTDYSITFTVTNSTTIDDVAYNPGDKVTVTGVITNYVSNGKTLHVFLGNNFCPRPTDPLDLNELREELIENHDRPNLYSWSLKTDDFKVDENGGIYYPMKVMSYELGGRPVGKHIYDSYPLVSYHPDTDYIHSWGGDKDDPDIMKINLSDLGTSSRGIPSTLWIQAGANAKQSINISLVDATAAGIGLEDVNVMSSSEAGEAIQTVDNAMAKVSRYRSSFGAEQNRLEHAMAVDDNTAENLQNSESKIRDSNMSEEIMEYAKHNILLETGHAVLAQANQSMQGILNLLH